MVLGSPRQRDNNEFCDEIRSHWYTMNARATKSTFAPGLTVDIYTTQNNRDQRCQSHRQVRRTECHVEISMTMTSVFPRWGGVLR